MAEATITMIVVASLVTKDIITTAVATILVTEP